MANTTLSVSAVDAKTGKSVETAIVFINGASTPQDTVPTGSAVQIVVKAEGYQTATKTITATGATATSFVSLSPIQDNGALNIQYSPVIPVSWSITGPHAESGTSGVDGTVAIDNLPNGTYTLVSTPQDTSIQPIQQIVTVSGSQGIVVQFAKAKADATAPPAAASTQESFPANYHDGLPSEEAIYSNTAYEGYFTATQARLYIGDLFIDELRVIQYAYQANVVPIFGYCSELVDAWGTGRKMVQGQLVVNYVHQGYLYSALTYTAGASSNPQSRATQIAQAAGVAGNAANNASTRASAARTLSSLFQTSSPSDVAAANTLIRKSRKPLDTMQPNPLSLRSTFNMRLEIGDGAQQSVRRLESCRLTGNEQIVNSETGEVIAENYTFVARRLL